MSDTAMHLIYIYICSFEYVLDTLENKESDYMVDQLIWELNQMHG